MPLKSCLPDLLAPWIRRQPLSAGKVALAWRLAVGPAVDRATTVRLRDDGVLEVITAAPEWRRELERATALVRERLAAVLGADAVRRIDVR